MRLVSFGAPGAERPGVLTGRGIVPLSDLDPSLPGTLRAALPELPRIRALSGAWDGPGLDPAQVRLGPPITDPGKLICVGLNYRGHATEQGKAWPEAPLLFAKAPSALCGCRDPIVLPPGDPGPDYEVELALVIGRRCRRVAPAEAAACIAGYMVGNDVSARHWQHAEGQWFRSKSCDTFYPCGPHLVTPDEAGDWRRLRLSTRIGEELLQDEVAGDLIHPVEALVAFISRTMTLEPGDIISTGTPSGVGCFRTPHRWLRPGETVRCAIAGLGELANPVQAEGPA